MSEPILWLPMSMLYEKVTEEHRRAKYVPQPTPFEKQCDRLKYLISTGYAEDAGELAKEIATKVYNERLDRNFCEHTGYPYFHYCEQY